MDLPVFPDFIQMLYESAIAPFEETESKIKAGEEPYIPSFNADYWTEVGRFLKSGRKPTSPSWSLAIGASA